jgi:hypothetical protein
MLAMVAWVGGLMFFAFVVAPTAFGTLASRHDAGLVVGGTLRILHLIGLFGGLAFCLATAWLWLWAEVPARVSFAIQLALTLVMLLVTAYSQYRILPTMERDRILAGGNIDAAALDNAGKIDFDRLHVLSERLEGLVLFCGLGVVYLLSRESQWPETGKIREYEQSSTKLE